jgi:UDP-N-acetylglucosamine 2-epimerase (non-hydrolysing)/GDP/UDP-N,N'-diacetylbacillosamine 2-epimerase (hydrolysing)
MRKIGIITGSRAEYGYLKPLMHAVHQDKNLELIPVITGMHLLSDYGNTYKLVEKDFPNAKKVPMPLHGDTLRDMTQYLSAGIKNLSDFFCNNPLDIVVVLGDRTETLAAALAALYLNIPIAHINGGDVSGTTIDESIRHAITKIAHMHFAHTKSNAERIEKLGEEKKRIFVTGALTIDTIQHLKLSPKEIIFRKYHLDPEKTTFLVVQHPITTLRDRGYLQMKELFLALDALQRQTILIYPNCDAGSKKLIDLIEEYSEKSYLHVFKNLSHIEYLSFMKSVNVMLGNSSSGIIEAPSFKIPVINIGTRQQGREKSENILDVDPKKDKIIQAINFALGNHDFLEKVKRCKNRFGGGAASQKIIKILKEFPIDDTILQKQITY